jgi:hypothetical protein
MRASYGNTPPLISYQGPTLVNGSQRPSRSGHIVYRVSYDLGLDSDREVFDKSKEVTVVVKTQLIFVLERSYFLENRDPCGSSCQFLGCLALGLRTAKKSSGYWATGKTFLAIYRWEIRTLVCTRASEHGITVWRNKWNGCVNIYVRARTRKSSTKSFERDVKRHVDLGF